MPDVYRSPLADRYASREMQRIFSPDRKFGTWRRLWLALAESERELGLPITEAQTDEMRRHLDDIDYDRAAEYERRLRHDVMAHIRTYADACPAAAPIIHLGATSCYVGDNTDVILMRDALSLIRERLLDAVEVTAGFARCHADVPTLAWTHFQAAQPTTAGKRATLWIADLLADLERLDFTLSRLRLLGCKGATGTSAGFLELFDGDESKVKRLEELIADKMGFAGCVPVSGQTYSRKTDYFVFSVLSGIAQSASKCAGDLRLLSHLKEFDEPFEDEQVGSSAMAYKRNPMRCERMASLSRYVIAQAANPAYTAATQWLERTLDDSANRRLCIPEAFLATDAVLLLWKNVLSGGRLYPAVMRRHLDEEMPFLATENILLELTRRGGDRQALHEVIRRHAVEVARAVKERGADNDLLDRLAADPAVPLTKQEMLALTDPADLCGRAPGQTREFLDEIVAPILAGRDSQNRADETVRV
ncbi:MAG: adenylosuccinate lyase [Clostridia bacterium]|nr:adenylosuccinate lyase [Clostridia bacterium]